MSPYSLPALVAFAINVSLVIIVLLDNPRSHTHRLFALLIFCFALWNFADIIVVNSTTPEAAAVGGAIIVAALLFASAFFLVLSFSFPRPIRSRFDRLPFRPMFLVLPLTFSILAGLGLFQPLLLHRFKAQGVYCYIANTTGGTLDVAMYAMVFAYLAWGVRNLTLQLKSSTQRKERRHILYTLTGTLGFALLVVLLGVLREHEAIHFYATRVMYLLISLSFAYVVLGNRLLILRRLGKEGLAYSVVTGLVFAFYLIVIKNIAETLGRQLGISSVVMEIVLILVLAVAFRPLVVRIQSLVEHLFSQSMFRRRQKFIQFSRSVFHLTTLPDLARAVRTFLADAIPATGSDMFVEGENAGMLHSVLSPGRTLHLNSGLTRFFTNHHKPHEVAELLGICSDEQRAVLQPFIGGYLIPLVAERGLIGVLAVGPKPTERPYTFDEEEFLSVFANEVTAAAERCVLIEKMQENEIRVTKMEKLAALGRLTAGIAHEFRNPLNIIATSAQTILRNPDNRELHQETGRYILEETDRLNRTVDDFLQFAKPHTPVWQQVMLDELIDRTITSLRQRSDAVGVHIYKEVCESLPPITTSPQHLERVLTNLGLNAIEAMSRGGRLTFIAKATDADSVAVSVKDTGPGIPTEYHPRLFDPFFTTKPAGTGLGLAIVYMMVQSMRGNISFTTNRTGTTFHIELPIDGSQK